jgi:capsular polysaccharide biosynthesis protein
MENNNNNKAVEEEINLLWLASALFKKIWLVIAVAVLCACMFVAYTVLRIEPTYTSTSTMLVLTKETTLTSLADLQIGSQLTKDYAILITSRPVLEEVIENLELDMNYKQLERKVEIENPEDTRLLFLSVTLNDAKLAKEVVDELSKVSSVFIGDKMEVTPPKIVEEGEVTGTKTGPNISKNALVGFLVGAFVVCAIVIVLELLNDYVQTEDDIERYLGIPTLAVVPDKTQAQKKERKRVSIRGKAK